MEGRRMSAHVFTDAVRRAGGDAGVAGPAGLRPSHDPRPLLPEVPRAEDTARRDPIHSPVSRAAHLENLAGRRGLANGRTTLGALGALETLTDGVPSPSRGCLPSEHCPPQPVESG